MTLSLGRSWHWALFAVILAGALLRLAWVEDMEYKGDERWTFERTQNVGRSESLPWLGMSTSYELRHPGGTVWVFVALGKLCGVQEPLGLGRACQGLNVLAILLLVLFAFGVVPAQQREPWLWAAALVSVNPLAVLLHRKIWPPSVIPAFTLLLVFCWWYRDRRLGAFAWGLVGGFIGFLYPAAMFLAAGFALWALLFDRQRVRWLPWLAGSAVGALPLVPWFCYVWSAMGTQPISQRRWTHLVEGKFWFRWLTEPFGISLQYSLGDDFLDFLRYPLVGGQATYLVGLLHAVIGLAAIVLLGRLAWALWGQRGQWRQLWIGRSATAFTQNACLWGFGLVFTATLLPIHRHYMCITFPLMFLWLARAGLAEHGSWLGSLKTGRRLLATVCVVQLLISVSFLGYIHANQRTIRGDYGLPYAAQARTTAQAQ